MAREQRYGDTFVYACGYGQHSVRKPCKQECYFYSVERNKWWKLPSLLPYDSDCEKQLQILGNKLLFMSRNQMQWLDMIDWKKGWTVSQDKKWASIRPHVMVPLSDTSFIVFE
jgi:hypothetical protein